MKYTIIILLLILFTGSFSYFHTDSNKKNDLTIVRNTSASDVIETKTSTEKSSTEVSINASIKPTDTEALTNQKHEATYRDGFDAFFNNDRQKAIDLENQVISEDPNFYKAYNLKGIALCYSSNFKDGMANIDKALELNPNFGYSRFNKALAYELYSYYDEALLWYDKNLEVENYKWSYYGKASIYGRRGDVANTIKYLKIAVSMDPAIKNDAKNEKDFNNVKNSKDFQHLVNN